MFAFAPPAADAPKAVLYADLCAAARALTAGEPDPIANMANVAALIWEFVPDLNWAGFYRVAGEVLVLGPFIGRPACLRIGFGAGRIEGVCGAAAARRQTQCVADVHAFAGHIACDAASRAELVVPLVHAERLLGVIDLDSPTPGRFDAEDARGIEVLAAALGPVLAGG